MLLFSFLVSVSHSCFYSHSRSRCIFLCVCTFFLAEKLKNQTLYLSLRTCPDSISLLRPSGPHPSPPSTMKHLEDSLSVFLLRQRRASSPHVSSFSPFSFSLLSSCPQTSSSTTAGRTAFVSHLGARVCVCAFMHACSALPLPPSPNTHTPSPVHYATLLKILSWSSNLNPSRL